MQHRFLCAALTAAVLLLSSSPSFAADNKANAPTPASSKARTVAKIKLVDINSARKEELKTLPDISDAQADKIIAGRPYGSKAHLLTRNIIDRAAYEKLKAQVIARQPNKDAAKNAALYSKKK